LHGVHRQLFREAGVTPRRSAGLFLISLAQE
jgi:hypothetical protein